MARLVEIVPATALHARHIARRMRPADREEVFVGSGLSPFDAIANSLRHSAKAYTGLVDGEPVAIVGVVDINVLAGVGVIWLLGTDGIDRNFVAFLRGSKPWTMQFFGRYRVLRNCVYVKNTVAVRWLQWMGATFTDPVNVNGHDFRLFELRPGNV